MISVRCAAILACATRPQTADHREHRRRLVANAISPAWPNAIQDLDRPVIDQEVLELEYEPITARELNADAQGSHLCDRLLRGSATFREDLLTPLLRGGS